MTREEKQKAIDALKISVPIMAVTQEEFNDYIRTLNKVMDWLEQEPNKSEIPTGSTTKNDLEVDCVSREAAITFVCKNTKEILKDNMPLEVKLSVDYIYENVAKIMRNPKVLPSVTPQTRKGHWKEHPHEAGPNWKYSMYECSECHGWLEDDSDYCPDCGARMVEPQESEAENGNDD